MLSIQFYLPNHNYHPAVNYIKKIWSGGMHIRASFEHAAVNIKLCSNLPNEMTSIIYIISGVHESYLYVAVIQRVVLARAYKRREGMQLHYLAT